MSEILAVIPAFNEEKTIGSIVLAARRHVDEVAVIDDGSTDGTVTIAELAGATVLRHAANRGYGAALRTGFEYARNNGTKVLVILDADGQHRPDLIPRVITPVLRGDADISIGSRFLDRESGKRVPLHRRFGIAVLTKLTNLGTRASHKVKDAQSGFRAFSRRAVNTLNIRETGMGASAEILWDADKNNLRVREVPIDVNYDLEGSTEGPVRHAYGVIGSMVRYIETEHPLAAFGIPGATLFGIGIVFGLDVVARYSSTGPPHELAVGHAILTVLFLVLGMLLGFTGLILHAVINANRRMR